jgi:hypothetical protein
MTEPLMLPWDRSPREPEGVGDCFIPVYRVVLVREASLVYERPQMRGCGAAG